MSLREYQRKRDFTKTAEPPASRPKKSGRRFVVQKHAATHLHYDLRLELGGTLKSWAVPKGLPFVHGEKRLAVHVEDHPVSYLDFEGVIPPGEYGGGTVMVWDAGTWEPQGKSPARDLAAGKLHFTLRGTKLEGEWYFVRLHDGDEWLVIRGGDDLKPLAKKVAGTSVLSGKSMAGIARNGQEQPKRQRSVKAPEFLAPMQAKLAAAPATSGDWIYEIKFDGYRAIALCSGTNVQIVSRNAKDLGTKFPEIRDAVSRLGLADTILDGEIVALDEAGRSSFQLLQAIESGDERPPIFYYVFDAPRFGGEDLRSLQLIDRKTHLAAALKGAPALIRLSPGLGSDVAALLDQTRRLGLEGLIGKRADSPYEAGRRSGAWIKLKLGLEQEFVIGGYTNPEGSRACFGALIVGVYSRQGGKELTYVGKVGTGFSDSKLRVLHTRLAQLAQPDCPFADLPQPRAARYGQAITAAQMRLCHWVKPQLVCQAKFAEWTRDGHFRHPVFVGLREDKRAREVVRENPSA